MMRLSGLRPFSCLSSFRGPPPWTMTLVGGDYGPAAQSGCRRPDGSDAGAMRPGTFGRVGLLIVIGSV